MQSLMRSDFRQKFSRKCEISGHVVLKISNERFKLEKFFFHFTDLNHQERTARKIIKIRVYHSWLESQVVQSTAGIICFCNN